MSNNSRPIQVVTVNHNTSPFAELVLRSLYTTHKNNEDIAITVCDNGSDDDMTDLRAYAAVKGVDIIQSGYPTRTKFNTHGEVLRNFVLSHPDCSYYLFLDSDMYFMEPDTIFKMKKELDADESLFAVQARDFAWEMQLREAAARGDTRFNMDNSSTEIVSIKYLRVIGPEPTDEELRNASKYECMQGPNRPRCHPFCALIKNTEQFRLVAEEIGFSEGWIGGVATSGFYDTFGLTTQVMRTHKQRYLLSSASVAHFGGITYFMKDALEEREKQCRTRLQWFRANGA